MNRRGFFGRFFGLAAAPLVAPKEWEEKKVEEVKLKSGETNFPKVVAMESGSIYPYFQSGFATIPSLASGAVTSGAILGFFSSISGGEW